MIRKIPTATMSKEEWTAGRNGGRFPMIEVDYGG